MSYFRIPGTERATRGRSKHLYRILYRSVAAVRVAVIYTAETLKEGRLYSSKMEKPGSAEGEEGAHTYKKKTIVIYLSATLKIRSRKYLAVSFRAILKEKFKSSSRGCIEIVYSNSYNNNNGGNNSSWNKKERPRRTLLLISHRRPQCPQRPRPRPRRYS